MSGGEAGEARKRTLDTGSGSTAGPQPLQPEPAVSQLTRGEGADPIPEPGTGGSPGAEGRAERGSYKLGRQKKSKPNIQSTLEPKEFHFQHGPGQTCRGDSGDVKAEEGPLFTANHLLKKEAETGSPAQQRKEQMCFLLFSRSVVSNSLRPRGLQHTRLPCPSLSRGLCSNSCPLSWGCHLTSPSHSPATASPFAFNLSQH